MFYSKNSRFLVPASTFLFKKNFQKPGRRVFALRIPTRSIVSGVLLNNKVGGRLASTLVILLPGY